MWVEFDDSTAEDAKRVRASPARGGLGVAISVAAADVPGLV